MSIYDSAHALARDISQSEEARDAQRLKEIAEEDQTNRALLHEMKRLQMALQMQAMGGEAVSPEDMQRFAQINSLLYLNEDVKAYLLAEMRLQQILADVFRIISEAGGISLDMLKA